MKKKSPQISSSVNSLARASENQEKMECHTLYFNDENIPVAVWAEERQIDIPMHRHDFSEIVIVTQGTGLHLTGHHTFELKPRDVFVINGERAHQYSKTKDLQVLNILYRPEMLDFERWEFDAIPGFQFLFHLEPLWKEKDDFQNHISLDPKKYRSLVELTLQLKEELALKRSGYAVASRLLLYEIILTLSRIGSDGIHERIKGFPSMDKLLKAVDYIKSHFQEEVSLEGIASNSNMSKRSLNDYFLNCYGVTPMKYLNRIRLKNAEKELRETKKMISEIAFKNGFNDSNFFSRQFTQSYKMNPKKFRNQFQKI